MADILIGDTYDSRYYDVAASQLGVDGLKTRSQEWMSQPRESSSDIVEILTYTFADRSPISSIAFDLLSVGAEVWLYYYDSTGTRLPLLRDDYNQIHFVVESREEWTRWQRWEFDCMSCVATKLEIRMRRVDDELAPDTEYSLGLRKVAIKRQVNSRDDAALPLQTTVDILGNTISKTVRDWDPSRAIDSDSYTFWKSEPQISQDAVVCVYLDVRDEHGMPQYIDTIGVDPVYSGSQLNAYVSNDPATGPRIPSHAAYDAVFSDTEHIVPSDGYRYAGYRMTQGSEIAADLTAAGFDKSDSWMVAMSWLPTAIPVGRNDIARIGESFRVMFDTEASTLELWYMFRGDEGDEWDHADIPLPCEIKYSRGTPQVDNVDTEVRLAFGMSRGSDEVLVLRCRVINSYANEGESIDSTSSDAPSHAAGEVIDDETGEVRLRVGAQISGILDGIQSDTRIEGGSVRRAPDTADRDYELMVPPNSSVEIPLTLPDLGLTPIDDEGYRVTVALDYRTSTPYINGGEVIIASGDESDEGWTSWWMGEENASPSRMNIGRDDQVTNWFQNPDLAEDGAWTPDEVVGQGKAQLDDGDLVLYGDIRVRCTTPFPVPIQGDRTYVFSAIPTFDPGVELGRDFSLFVYDNDSERFLAYAARPVTSGERTWLRIDLPSDTNGVTFGFVGGSTDTSVVRWSKPMLVTLEDYLSMTRLGVDFFSGATYRSDNATLPRYNDELNINPTNDPDLPTIGRVVSPAWCVKRPFTTNIVAIEPGLNWYSQVDKVDWWMPAKGGSTFTFSFWCISENGWSQLQPVIIDQSGNRYFPDHYQYTVGDGSWHLVYARVSLPNEHAAENVTFGIYEDDSHAHSCMGELHVYPGTLAFEDPSLYNRVMVERRFEDALGIGAMRGLRVVVRNADVDPIYISACSIRVTARDVSDVDGTTVRVGHVTGVLQNVAVKQEGLPVDSADDRFMQNPTIYTSPDSYDESSTLYDALVYGRFQYEDVVRGGIGDASYEVKAWTPVLIGKTVERTDWRLDNPVRVSYVKLELSQLTPIQYPIEADGISQTYRAFPAQQTREMMARNNIDSTSTNSRQTATSRYGNVLSDRQLSYYRSTDLNATDSRSSLRDIYQNPDVEVITAANPNTHNPMMSGTAISDATKTETTSSSLLTTVGSTMAALTSSAGGSTYAAASRMNAEYAIYTATAGETLVSVAERLGLSDWRLIRESETYINDKSERTAVSGRMPGYWVMPGQQLLVPVQQLRQIVGTSRVDLIERSASKQVSTTVTDVRTTVPSLGVNGPRYFSGTCVHSYDTRTGTRTQSVAYFAALREVRIGVTDYLQTRDNVEWNLYSMAMPVWHTEHGYITSQEVFVPDMSTGTDVAVAETRPMHSQSVFRTVKLISVNRDTLTNRRYFEFGGQTYHSAQYWAANPQLNGTWDDSTPADPWAESDNGGAWDSTRFAWGEGWNIDVSAGQSPDTYYDGELVKHIVVEPEDRVFNDDGTQAPYVYKIGDMFIPSHCYAAIGVEIYAVNDPNPGRPGDTMDTRMQLASWQYAKDPLIDEPVAFDGSRTNTWQSFSSSRYRLDNVTSLCDAYVSFNNFERLDVYIRGMYVETGTLRVLMRNRDDSDYEDVTSAVGRSDSEYTFRRAGSTIQVRVEMYDPQDWFSSLDVIPVYIPKDAAPDA